ncbi:MAG TPA: c-type cytochrome [Pirellulales bacterium]
MKKAIASSIAVVVVLGVSLSAVLARPQYKQEFDAKYVKKDSANPAEKTLAEAVATAKCQVCHGKNDKGIEDKKVRNHYGAALGKLVGKNQKDKEKIAAALDEVAKEKSHPDKPNAPAFGELIKEGKLPGGN